MDYNKKTYQSLVFPVVAFLFLLVAGCADNGKDKRMNVKNTCYVEIVNTIDTLKKVLGKNLYGKVTFYKNNELEIRSFNYLGDEEYPDMIFYKPISELGNDTPANTRKLKIELTGNYTIDSTYYSITQFRYVNKEWKKFSDQGWTKATMESTSRLGTDSIRFWQLSQQIVKNSFVTAHNK